MEFQLSYFKILKDNAVKVLQSICQQIWKTQQWPQDWKKSVFIPIPKIGNAKECSNYCTIALISQASKVMLKILQARFQYSMFKVRRGGHVEIPLIQDKEQQLRFAEAAVKRYPTSKVRGTQDGRP